MKFIKDPNCFKIFIIFTLSVLLVSCKKNQVSRTQSNTPYFLELEVGGTTKTVDSNYINGFQYTDQNGCEIAKQYCVSNIGQIDFDIHSMPQTVEVYIHHYERDIDFLGTTTGNHRIFEVNNFTPNSPTNACNMDIWVGWFDGSIMTRIDSTVFGGYNFHNTINSIEKVSETSSEVKYDIEGDFECDVSHEVSYQHWQITHLKGRYKTFIYTKK